MKREIKFRAWDKENECYLYDIQRAYDMLSGCVKYDDGEDAIYEEECFAGFLDNEQYIIEQYTGLHDKNGREIYEGDLFEHRFGYVVFDDPPHHEMGTECGVVVLEDGQFGVKIPGLGVYNLYGLLLRDGHLDNMPKDDLFVMKIAGNIYENPELLEADHE
ncbi:YopX family protein [Lacticaseibacillus paracasei]|uniref:YopX family protein n=1 Tax=Lacticaseibacillus paracasei TaxID=1597 RepID=UPI0022E36B5E|nr:YopX family protein [Lacticaseibacillus paracasei]